MKILRMAAVLAAFFVIGAAPAQAAQQGLKAEAVEALNRKDFDRAVRLLDEAAEADPFDDDAKLMLAAASRARGWELYNGERFEEGYDFFRKAMRVEPKKDADTYLGLGYGAFRLKQGDDALYYLYDAVYLAPDDPRGHEIIGAIYYLRGRLAEAIEEWSLALKLNPDNADVVMLLEKARKEQAVEGEFTKRETYYFKIKYEGDERRELGDAVLEILDGAYKDVGGDLEYYPREPVTVVLYTREQFSDVTDAPSWSEGIFDGTIRVPVGGKVDRDALAAVLYHEYAHFVTAMVAGNKVPTWLAEGIAMHEERWVRRLRVGLDRARIRPLSELGGSFVGIRDPEVVQAAYAQSLSVVSYYVEAFGSYSLAKLVRLIGEGKPLDEAVRGATGVTLDDVERYWLAELGG